MSRFQAVVVGVLTLVLLTFTGCAGQLQATPTPDIDATVEARFQERVQATTVGQATAVVTPTPAPVATSTPRPSPSPSRTVEELISSAMGARGRGNAGIAVELLHLAIEIDPESWQLWYLLGLAYKDHVLLHDRYARAKQAFLKAASFTNVPHEKAEAFTSFTILEILDPVHGFPILAYQFVAVELEPDNPYHWAWLGQGYAKSGEWYKARDAWVKALELDPNDSDTLAFMKLQQDRLDRLSDYPFKRPADLATPVAIKPKFGFPFEVIVTLLEVHRGDEEVCQHLTSIGILKDRCTPESLEKMNSIFEGEEYILVGVRYNLKGQPSSDTSLYPIIDDFTFSLTYEQDDTMHSGSGLASSLGQGTYYAAPGESIKFWELHLVPRDIEKPRLRFSHDRRLYYFKLYTEKG